MSEHLEAVRVALQSLYSVECELGSGGMATVFLAEDLKHSRKVAVKVLRPELVALLGTERFLREIGIAATLQHPHILPLHDSGEADGFLFYVMPYVDGETLREKIQREERLPWQEAISIVREIASALDYAHAQDVVHRDIKPENVLMSQGHAVVADFGIASALNSSDESHATRMGFALGTPAYMSPEQAATDPDLDGRADIYSMGCVAYELIVGQPPFHGTNSKGVIAESVRNQAPVVSLGVSGGVPASVDRAIAKALEKDPDNRFATAAQLRDALSETEKPFLTPSGAAAAVAVAAVAIVGVFYFLANQLGLPYWPLSVLAVGGAVALPFSFQAARVEQGSAAPGFLTWKRFLRATVVFLVVLFFGVTVDVAMRVAGLGPAGALLASGAIERSERIILADFDNHTADSTLGEVVTEVFRIDFEQTPVVRLVERSVVDQALTLMEQPNSTVLSVDAAREVAVRNGIKAVMTGEINSAGSGLVISARLFSAEDGDVLAAFRENAASQDEVIDAVDRLSRRMRERIGESLQSIRSGEPLSEVTTSSLAALRSYSSGSRAFDRGDMLTARALMGEAIELDPNFAMAYRALGLMPFSRSEQVRMLQKAMELRHRLTRRERALTEGSYYRSVSNEPERAITAYNTLLAVYPDDNTALSNLGNTYNGLGDFDRAVPLFEQVIEKDSLRPGAYIGLIQAHVGRGDFAAAERVLGQMEMNLPGNPAPASVGVAVRVAALEYDSAFSDIRDLMDQSGSNAVVRLTANSQFALLSYLTGRLSDGDRYLNAALEDTERLGLGPASLNSTIVRAVVQLWFRNDAAWGMEQIPRAFERFPMSEIDPLDRPYLPLAQFYALAGEADEATRVLQEFEREVPEDLRGVLGPAGHLIRGLIALAEERPLEAVRELALGEQPSCPKCNLAMIGRAFDKAGMPDSVIASYNEYLATPHLGRYLVDWIWRGRAYLRLGQLYEASGETELAIKNYDLLANLWENADEDLQPLVADARAGIARLSSEGN